MATSFNAPLKVYARENATNDGSGNHLVDNSSAVLGVQFSRQTVWNAGSQSVNIARIPAGSYLKDVVLHVQAVSNPVGAETVNVEFVPDGGSAVVVGSFQIPATTAATSTREVIDWTTTAAETIFNVGATPGYLRFGNASLAATTVTEFAVEYVTRNADGTLTNTGANLVNE